MLHGVLVGLEIVQRKSYMTVGWGEKGYDHFGGGF